MADASLRVSYELVAPVFDTLPHVPTPSSQSDPVSYLNLFDTFCSHDPFHLKWLPGVRSAFLEVLDEKHKIRPFPEYGCVLVSLQSIGCHCEPTFTLHLLAPDQWKHHIHLQRKSTSQFFATPSDLVDLAVGSVSVANYNEWMQRFDKSFEVAKTKTGNDRSAATNEQGHQKTPAFILALLQDSLLERKKDSSPRGGFTDVGLHTGGIERETTWPLAQAIIQFSIDQLIVCPSLDIFRLVMLHFRLWLLEESATPLGGSTCTQFDVDNIGRMIQRCAMDGAVLSDEGHDLLHVEKSLQRLKDSLQIIFQLQCLDISMQYQLPAPSELTSMCSNDAYIHPTLTPMAFVPSHQTGQSLFELKWRAEINLVPVPLFLVDASTSFTASWSDLQRWIQARQLEIQKKHDTSKAVLVLRTIETWFYHHALTLNDKQERSLSEDESVTMLGIVNIYIKLYKQHLSSTEAVAMAVQERSHRVLLCWIAYCLADKAARTFFTGHDEFGTSLQYQDLQYLSLSNKLEMDALLHVCKYRQQTSDRPPVFSLRKDDATLGLALKYSRQCPVIQDQWADEQESAKQRRDVRWQKVLNKRERIERLEEHLADLERQERAAQDAYQEWDRAHYYDIYKYKNPESKERDSAALAVRRKRAEIEAEKKAPAPVIQPLPSNDKQALRVLFFLNLPKHYNVLSALSFIAQQSSLPVPLQTNIEVEKFKMTFVDHCNKYSKLSYQPSFLTFGSSSSVPSSGPSFVSQCLSPEDGVWHPNFNPELGWSGEGCEHSSYYSLINPFLAIPDQERIEYFTEKLSSEFKDLQQFLPCHESRDSNRGNIGIASQDKIPNFMSKPQYLTLTSLRADPHLQLHKLCAFIHDRSLPFAHPVVQLFVRHALYHVGTLSEDALGNVSPLWKADQFHGDFIKALFDEMIGFIEEIAGKPRDQEAFFFATDVCSYLMHWLSGQMRSDLKQKIMKILNERSYSLQQRIESVSESTLVSQLKARQGEIFMQGVLLFEGTFELSDNDVFNLIRFCVRARNQYVHENNAKNKSLFRSLRQRCVNVMSLRISRIVNSINENLSYLTQIFNEVIRCTPVNLIWKESENSKLSGCFEATSAGHLYSINVLTGAVLFDGNPPSSLPRDILGHSLFQRCFGDRDFEVVLTSKKQLRTTCAHFGNFYEFCLGSQSALQVIEIPDNPENALELLDFETARTWGPSLPVRLREMYSHWYCRSRDIVVFRPISFEKHDIHFIFLVKEQLCYKIPIHLRQRSLTDLVQMISNKEKVVEKLILWNEKSAPFLQVLGKFESLEFIHSYVNDTTGEIGIELPRFGLEFAIQGGHLASRNLNGFRLSQQQQWSDRLVGFTQYLVLEHQYSGEIRMIVPDLEVEIGAQGYAFSLQILECHHEMRYFSFYHHSRFQEFRARNLVSRLHLASLFAACSTFLPESHSKMTGIEVAIRLVRRCFVDQPLTGEEESKVKNLMRLSWKAPSLYLLCCDLLNLSRKLYFLHTGSESMENHQIKSNESGTLYSDLSSSYLADRIHLPWRCLLTEEEERRILGCKARRFVSSCGRSPAPAVSMPKKPVEAEFSKGIQKQLKSLIKIQKSRSSSQHCLIAATSSSPLESEMYQELKKSWDTHQNQSEISIVRSIDPLNLLQLFRGLSKQVKEKCQEMEKFLLSCFSFLKPSLTWTSCGRRLLFHANLLPIATPADLISGLWNREFLLIMNPSFSDFQSFNDSVLFWMELCVLEDKMHRLNQILDSTGNGVPQTFDLIEVDLCRELSVERTWNSKDHPEWLAFEVDQQIQIRPQQYLVAKTLIDNPGAIIQLNMGEGKTRVILPMLFLHWTRPVDGQRKEIVRLNFLSPLLHEALVYFRQTLCDGVLNRPISLFQFHRDVALTENRIKVMIDQAQYCQRIGGAILVAPESRCSLKLKSNESQKAGKVDISRGLQEFENLPWRDVFDESDELLRHKYQLIYAEGDPQRLPSLDERVHVVSALLNLLHRDEDVKEVILNNPTVFVVEENDQSHEFFCSIRLISSPTAVSAMKTLRDTLAKTVIDRPTYEMKWMGRFERKGDLFRYITDSSTSADDILPKNSFEDESHRETALALRGMLACGILEHCLRQRHRVHFGLAPQLKRKQLAVPFRACDVPSERSEFAHPDVALTLTMLAYFYDGLDSEQLRETFNKLLKMGPNAQSDFYDAWFDRSKVVMVEGHSSSLDSVMKIDLTNPEQSTLLQRYFKRNPLTISFWLLHCALPRDMIQYPERLKASAWHLVEQSNGPQAVGFSGTNDSHRLLPLQVDQKFIPDSEIEATNGKMLDLILQHAKVIEEACLVDSWQQLIDIAIDQGASALIDAGALLAGVKGIEAAKYVLKKHSGLKAVVFFEEGTWMVLDAQRYKCSLTVSPIREDEAFVIFGEQHCRGADMRLRPDALAILTLGPKMCKDKFMQAAGRLRRLGRNQHIQIVMQSDVLRQIKEFSHIDVISIKEILAWVMSNTVKSTEEGLLEWASNGIQFCLSRGDNGQHFQKEILTLEEFYSKAISEQTINVIVQTHVQKQSMQVQESLATFLEAIQARSVQYGSHCKMTTSTADEECERELQKEVELQEEVETQIPRAKPRDESDWKFLISLRFDQLVSIADAKPLHESFLAAPTLQKYQWDSRIFATNNFVQTIENLSYYNGRFKFCSDLFNYLRPVSFLLAFDDGRVILISDREADRIACTLWNSPQDQQIRVKLVPFMSAHFKRSIDSSVPDLASPTLKTPWLVLPFRRRNSDDDMYDTGISPTTLAQIQFFSGDTMFSSNSVREGLLPILQPLESRSNAFSIAQIRGFAHCVSRSDLEKLCGLEGSHKLLPQLRIVPKKESK